VLRPEGAASGSVGGVLRSIRWSSLAVVVGASVLAVVCLVFALRGRAWAVVVGVVCLATAVRELRALRRMDRRPDRRARPARRPLP
jgi:uncharacterized membrane protein YedE/YeeE